MFYRVTKEKKDKIFIRNGKCWADGSGYASDIKPRYRRQGQRSPAIQTELTDMQRTHSHSLGLFSYQHAHVETHNSLSGRKSTVGSYSKTSGYTFASTQRWRAHEQITTNAENKRRRGAQGSKENPPGRWLLPWLSVLLLLWSYLVQALRELPVITCIITLLTLTSQLVTLLRNWKECRPLSWKLTTETSLPLYQALNTRDAFIMLKLLHNVEY